MKRIKWKRCRRCRAQRGALGRYPQHQRLRVANARNVIVERCTYANGWMVHVYKANQPVTWHRRRVDAKRAVECILARLDLP